jgi:hypothetical protein
MTHSLKGLDYTGCVRVSLTHLKFKEKPRVMITTSIPLFWPRCIVPVTWAVLLNGA